MNLVWVLAAALAVSIAVLAGLHEAKKRRRAHAHR